MPYVILDRDGVINYDSDVYIKAPEEWIPIPGSLEAIARLNQHHYQVLIVTNQSGIARGLYDHSILKKIHEKLILELNKVGGKISDIFYCPHHPDEKCVCRKPQPGLIHALLEKHQVPLNETYFIGDSYTDMQVALHVGCKPLLVLTGNGKKTLSNYNLENIPSFSNLASAVDYILNGKNN